MWLEIFMAVIIVLFFVRLVFPLPRTVLGWQEVKEFLVQGGAVSLSPDELHEQIRRIPPGEPLLCQQTCAFVYLVFRGGASPQIGSAHFVDRDKEIVITWVGENPVYRTKLNKFTAALFGLDTDLSREYLFLPKRHRVVKEISMLDPK